MTDATQRPSRLSPGDRLILAALSLALLGLCGLHVARARGLAGPAPEIREAERVSSHVIDVNTAPWWELQAIRGIGEKRARAIVECREKKNGGFASVEELVEVRGIGLRSLEPMRPYLTVQARDTSDGKAQ